MKAKKQSAAYERGQSVRVAVGSTVDAVGAFAQTVGSRVRRVAKSKASAVAEFVRGVAGL
jgi:hypothetical protein